MIVRQKTLDAERRAHADTQAELGRANAGWAAALARGTSERMLFERFIDLLRESRKEIAAAKDAEIARLGNLLTVGSPEKPAPVISMSSIEPETVALREFDSEVVRVGMDSIRQVYLDADIKPPSDEELAAEARQALAGQPIRRAG